MKQPSNIQLKGEELVAFKNHIQGIDQVYVAIGNEEIQIADQLGA